MNSYAAKILEDNEVLSQYDRSLIDTIWLEKMSQQCNKDSVAQKHYTSQLKKEVGWLRILEDEIEKRGLIH